VSQLQPASEEMSAFDAFLFRGDADPRTRAQVAAAYLLGGPLGRQRFVDIFDRASRLIPRLRQRVVAPPLPIFLPSWVVDPDFDITRHVRFLRAARPGSLRQLLDVVETEVETALDSSRPLWEAVLVEGMIHDRCAVIIKMSHAVTDGIGALRLFAELFDRTVDADRGPMPRVPVPEDVTPEELQRRALSRAPWATAGLLTGTARNLLGVATRFLDGPERAAAEVRDYFASLGRILGTVAPPSPALAGRSSARRCLVLEAPLADLRRAGKASGTSVNDVYLAAVAGGLRRYHEALGMPVDALPMAVPVNLRTADDPAAGNHFGGILLAAPVGLADPRERLALVHERMLAGRAEPAIEAPSVIAPVMARLPESLLRGIAERTPRPDIQASNIPGWTEPIYFGGRRVVASYAFGPVPGVAAMLTMQSLAGTCFVGVNLDPAAITRPGVFASSLRSGFIEVLGLGGRAPRVSRPVMGRRHQGKAA
jgi:WS/DGAT/MGAT family acyltransferase